MKSSFTTYRNRWLTLEVTPDMERQAQDIRASRDALYGNIFEERSTDIRWVGELGEIAFNLWLREQIGDRFKWLDKDTSGKPDFMIGDQPIGVKTVKRNVPMLLTYEAQITAKHAQEPVEQFFFACYELTSRQLHLLGGKSKKAFLAEARYFKEGEWVHKNYQIRPGHAIYNIQVSRLLRPVAWLARITQDL